MKSLDELRKLKDELQKDMKMRAENGDQPKIIVGMGTCGIAAGAREILQTVMEEIDKRDVEVTVNQTGCIGMCEKEPLLDVKLPQKQRITYGNLTPQDVRKIIIEHVINGNIVEDLVIARHE